MSRCFPYPPPGYSGKGATYEALIESIKLQKETEKAKAERKKEKRARKEKKKEKEKKKDKENEKSKKNPNGFHTDIQKGTQSSADLKEAHDERREPSIEHLERSDLTEEHCQPVSSHKPSYSSDSTQNSNKRKRDDAAIFPDGTNAKPIKIRLLKKHQGPDSSKETLCSTSGRTDSPNLCNEDPRANNLGTSTSGRTDLAAPIVSNSVARVPGLCPKDRTLLASNSRRIGLSAPSKTENHEVQKSTSSFAQLAGLHPKDTATLAPNSGRIGGLSEPSKTENCAVQKSTPTTSFARPGKPAPFGTKNNDAQGLLLSGKRSIPSSGRAVLPPSHLNNGLSITNSIQTELSIPPPLPAPQVTAQKRKTGLSAPPAPQVTAEKRKTGPSAPLASQRPVDKRSSSEVPVLGKANAEVVRPTRAERKMKKQHAKYEKLVGSWVPQDFLPPVCDGDDEDWLSRKMDVSGNKEDKVCRSSMDDDMSCRESAASSLWQPAARLLPEADIYALPFTVPF